MENVRQAKKDDSKFISQLMFLAMDEIIYSFIGEKNKKKGIDFLEQLIKKEKNQYSYENTIVIEIDNKIIGSCTFYDGSLLEILRKPVIELLKREFNKTLTFEDETSEGEIYIDTISISNKYQGKGFGSKILDYLIEEIVVKNKKTLGLLVDLKNCKAKELYKKKKFVVVGKKILGDIEHEHMQRFP